MKTNAFVKASWRRKTLFKFSFEKYEVKNCSVVFKPVSTTHVATDNFCWSHKVVALWRVCPWRLKMSDSGLDYFKWAAEPSDFLGSTFFSVWLNVCHTLVVSEFLKEKVTTAALLFHVTPHVLPKDLFFGKWRIMGKVLFVDCKKKVMVWQTVFLILRDCKSNWNIP